MTFQIKAPMVNVNEDEIELVEWHKEKDQFVRKGELLATFESTKSTFEFSAPETGYLTPLVENGEVVEVGQIIGYFSDEKSAPMDIPAVPPSNEVEKTEEIHWTKKAQMLAEQHQLDPALILTGTTEQRITEKIVRDFLSRQSQPNATSNQQAIVHGIERVLILGGGNVATLVIDILNRIPQQSPIGILDDDPQLQGRSVLGVPVLGTFEAIDALHQQNAFDAAALAVGILPARKELFEQLTQRGIPFTNIIDPTAVIGINASMGTGNMIMAFCRLGPESTIGDNNFLSAYVNIEHHNQLGSHCTFGPSVYMSGGVHIGNAVRFGTGISIEPRLTIGERAIIASGVTITTNVPPDTVVKAKTNFTF